LRLPAVRQAFGAEVCEMVASGTAHRPFGSQGKHECLYHWVEPVAWARQGRLPGTACRAPTEKIEGKEPARRRRYERLQLHGD
jgi:hypothetical protein